MMREDLQDDLRSCEDVQGSTIVRIYKIDISDDEPFRWSAVATVVSNPPRVLLSAPAKKGGPTVAPGM